MKDDIQVVAQFPCLLGHPVQYEDKRPGAQTEELVELVLALH